MIGNVHLRPLQRRRARPLDRWQRLLVTGALLFALTISAALVIFRPGERSFTQTGPAPAAPAGDVAPALPPGTDTYYYWGQHRPLSQQP
jgi:hypothetical protein